jgi:hypothetical protein
VLAIASRNVAAACNEQAANAMNDINTAVVNISRRAIAGYQTVDACVRARRVPDFSDLAYRTWLVFPTQAKVVLADCDPAILYNYRTLNKNNKLTPFVTRLPLIEVDIAGRRFHRAMPTSNFTTFDVKTDRPRLGLKTSWFLQPIPENYTMGVRLRLPLPHVYPSVSMTEARGLDHIMKVERELTVPKLLTVPDRDLFAQRLVQAACALKHEYKLCMSVGLERGHNPVQETVLGHGLALNHTSELNSKVSHFVLGH